MQLSKVTVRTKTRAEVYQLPEKRGSLKKFIYVSTLTKIHTARVDAVKRWDVGKQGPGVNRHELWPFLD